MPVPAPWLGKRQGFTYALGASAIGPLAPVCGCHAVPSKASSTGQAGNGGAPIVVVVVRATTVAFSAPILTERAEADGRLTWRDSCVGLGPITASGDDVGVLTGSGGAGTLVTDDAAEPDLPQLRGRLDDASGSVKATQEAHCTASATGGTTVPQPTVASGPCQPARTVVTATTPAQGGKGTRASRVWGVPSFGAVAIKGKAGSTPERGVVLLDCATHGSHGPVDSSDPLA